VLAGPPNAGKSALANVLTGRPVSIVHDTAGTTRDWIREQAILDGRAVWLTDTAGLWNATDGVDSCCQATPRLAEQDAEAVHRAWDRIDAADLAVLCIPADARDDAASNELPALRSSRLIHVPSLTVRTKADLRSAPSVVPASPRGDDDDLSSVHHSEFITHHLACSAETSAGLPQLRAAILDALGLADIDPVAPAAFTRRQADLLDRAADAAETGHASAAVACARALLGFD
ncbi:MAG: 50S ribosome-binding GTPase, partial [Phycisphaerae bacterium]|nr:50S ribosome-binding GTPase [Phycisphaerae bacterium]